MNTPEIDKKYVFFDKNGKTLGCGIWKKNHIITIPDTCGCNGIHVSDVEMWHEFFEPNSEWIIQLKNPT